MATNDRQPSSPSIEPFVHRKVVVLSEEATAMQAARAMSDHRIGSVIVGDHKGHITGIVTDRDVTCSLTAYLDDIQVPLAELMSTKPITVEESASVKDVVATMIENGIRRVPVIERSATGHERCVGVVTLDDLIVARAISYDDLVTIVRSQVYRRGGVTIKRRYEDPDDAGARSQAHLDQTFNRFFRVVAERTGLPKEKAIELGRTVLGAFVERLHSTAAAHLISHLPKMLQDSLLDLPAGPNREITVATIVRQVSERCGLPQQWSKTMLYRFCGSLRELLGGRELEHLCVQLPKDIRKLFEDAGGHSRSAA